MLEPGGESICQTIRFFQLSLPVIYIVLHFTGLLPTEMRTGHLFVPGVAQSLRSQIAENGANCAFFSNLLVSEAECPLGKALPE